MAKLYFNYSTMNAGKSTMLLQASYNYQERGMRQSEGGGDPAERLRKQAARPCSGKLCRKR